MITQLLNDYNIPFSTKGKNVSPGWINLQCPFCNDISNHLGWNMKEKYFNCWRCGWHSTSKTITKLLNISENDAKKLLKKYNIFTEDINFSEKNKNITSRKPYILPPNTSSFTLSHKKYLEKRGFDPDKLEKEWNLFGTGPVSILDGINFRFRIIIPYFWDGRQVTFSSRDITENSKIRYIHCPKDRELISVKNILYGKKHLWKDTGICVEGPTDVWRLGEYSFATSGIQYTTKQLRLMAKLFKRIAVCFDEDADEQAEKLISELQFRGVEAFRIKIKGDPGSMPQDEADYLVKQIIFQKFFV